MGETAMRLMHIAMTGALVVATLGATAKIASAQSCLDLWVERNNYYKQAGYCFKTSRAISYFGNGGCIYNNERDVPLSGSVRARINQIVALERAYRCPG
jgi:hypothetical protein